MSNAPLTLTLATAAILLAACKEETATIPPPSQDCICARACGVPVVGNAYWVNAAGESVALGFCPPLNDEIIQDSRARCQCAQTVPGMGTLPRSAPNY